MTADSTLRTVRNALHQTLATVPYNSAVPFHHYFPPWHESTRSPALGHACAWQSLGLARTLAKDFDGVRLLQDGRHLTVVVPFEPDVIVVDPYLLQLEPMVIPLSSGDNVIDVDALPVRTVDGRRQPSQLRGRYYAATGRLVLQHRVADPVDGRLVVRRHFEFDLEEVGLNPQDDLPSALVTPLLLHPEQDNVSVRAVDLVALETLEMSIRYEDSGQSALVHHGLFTRDCDGQEFPFGTDGYRHTADRIAELLAVNTVYVEDHLINAVLTQRSLRTILAGNRPESCGPSVFLSGTMQGSSETGEVRDQDYRRRLAEALEARFADVIVVDPFVYLVERLASAEATLREEHDILAKAEHPRPRLAEHGFHPVLNVFDHQVAMARQSDVCVAFMPGSEPSLGTAMEMRAAWDAGAVVLAITEMTKHLAILASCHRIIRTLEEFLCLLDDGELDHYFEGGNIRRDF